MDVTTAIGARRSVRGFLPDEPDPAVLRTIARTAARAATGGNLQPWHVDIVRGAAMARLKAIMAQKVAARETETPGYAIYPAELPAANKARRFANGEALYAALGIPRDNKPGRAMWFARNFQFFGAPAAFFVSVDRRMGPPQWADLGMYVQNVMLLAVEAGLATCAQESWAVFPETVGAFLQMPAERMLFCGIAIGREDPADPANAMRSDRAPDAEWLTEVT